MFKLIKEIRSKEGTLHFKRWNILTSERLNFSIYLHGIYKADEDLHLHNHPWNIATIILWGSYNETVSSFIEPIDRQYPLIKRHWLHFGKRTKQDYHKIQSLNSKRVFSLAFVWGKRTNWGYLVDGDFIDHIIYRKINSNLSDNQKTILSLLRSHFYTDSIFFTKDYKILFQGHIIEYDLPSDNSYYTFDLIQNIINAIHKHVDDNIAQMYLKFTNKTI